ncbi:MAG TPA: MFS transporter [Bryobacteraceae bacterium]|nr:MFS transporter [Bryobacteraceae bacterium]
MALRPTGLSSRERGLLVLLVASIFINYIDRANLSIAAPMLAEELALTPGQLGLLFGSFFWTYALLQLFGIAGWFADRYPVGWVFAWGFVIWTLATAASGIVTGFAALYAMRLILGAGESIAYPCYSKIIAGDIPATHRGLANALIDAGSKLGPALGTLLGGYMAAQLGWRMFFVVLGVGSLVWLIPWLRYMPRGGASDTRDIATAPRTGAILSQRSAWGTFLGHFCGNYYWFFLLTWLPTYLVKERGYSMEGMARVGGFAYFAIAAATIVAGWFSDRWIASGATVTKVRKTIVVGGLLGSTIILPVAAVQDLHVSIVLLLLACVSFGVYVSNHWAITQTLSGPLAAGRWTSIQNGVGNLSGIVAPWLTGVVVERTGSFHLAFVAAAAVALTGALLWGMAVGPVKEVAWPAPNPSAGKAN